MDITASGQYSNDVRTLAKAYITFSIGKFVFFYLEMSTLFAYLVCFLFWKLVW